MSHLPNKWEIFLEQQGFDIKNFYSELDAFLKQFDLIIPAEENIFAVFNYMNPTDVKCVLYGEDPYPRIKSGC